MSLDKDGCPLIPALGPAAYERWRASSIGEIVERLERRLILELMGDVRGKRVLDVGCGDGAFAVELRARGAEVVGIDASPAMITAAQRRAEGASALAFEVACARELPFPSESFDCVSAITILCFVEEAGPEFREMARVLRPGGRLVIGELGKWNTWAAARRVRAWLGSALWRRARFRTARELRALCEQAGLQVGTVRGAIFFPRSASVARALLPFERTLGRLTTVGAAFITLSATKPVPEHAGVQCAGADKSGSGP